MSYQKTPLICPVCKEKTEFKFIQDFKRLDKEFSLYECSECQVQFWEPLKSARDIFYISGIKISIFNRFFKKLNLSWWEKKGLKILKHLKNIKGKKLIDLGCGRGAFLNEARKLGLDTWGVDFDKEAIKIAKDFYNLPNLYAESWRIFSQRKDIPKFDIITSFEVIEHLDDIADFLNFIVEIANPSALIIVSTPNRNRKSLAVDFAGDSPPSHLTRWNEYSLNKNLSCHRIKVRYRIYGGDIEHIMRTCFQFNFTNKIMTNLNSVRKRKEKLNFQTKHISSLFYHIAKIKNLLFIPIAFCIFKIRKFLNPNFLPEEEKPFLLVVGEIGD